MKDPLTQTNQTSNPIFKLLLVEDAIAERSILTAILQKLAYEIVAVSNGKEALLAMEESAFDIIVSDWKMPVMDGFSLCKKVNEFKESAPYFILLTGQDSKCDLIAAMDVGADDFITKPYNTEELRARLQAGKRIISMRKSLQEKNHVIGAALDRETSITQQLQADMVAAEKLQRSLLPKGEHHLGKVSLAHYFRASNGVAGDSFNLIPLNENYLAFYHIDVAGHGVRAAMHSFNISRQLSDPNQINKLRQIDSATGAIRITPPSEVITALNKAFESNDQCSDYYTMIYGVLDCDSGQGVFSQAGMPLPFLVKSSDEVVILGQGGFPVGMLDDANYHDQHFTLNHGERLVLYSDGILSCKLANGQELTEKTLAKLLQKFSEVDIQKLHQKIPNIFSSIIHQNSFEDDISIMIIERTVKEKASSQSRESNNVIGLTEANNTATDTLMHRSAER